MRLTEDNRAKLRQLSEALGAIVLGAGLGLAGNEVVRRLNQYQDRSKLGVDTNSTVQLMHAIDFKDLEAIASGKYEKHAGRHGAVSRFSGTALGALGGAVTPVAAVVPLMFGGGLYGRLEALQQFKKEDPGKFKKAYDRVKREKGM